MEEESPIESSATAGGVRRASISEPRQEHDRYVEEIQARVSEVASLEQEAATTFYLFRRRNAAAECHADAATDRSSQAVEYPRVLSVPVNNGRPHSLEVPLPQNSVFTFGSVSSPPP
jgi:hypothetical protein